MRTEAAGGHMVETRFEYDALGRRTARHESHTEAGGMARHERTRRFVWQGLRMVQELRDSGLSNYVYSPDSPYTPMARVDQYVGPLQPQYVFDAQGQAHEVEQKARPRVLHFHTDLVGAPLEVTDSEGELAWVGEYSAWGRVNPDGAHQLDARIEQNLRYPGQYADDSTGLHYNTFRYYDPDVGRFISQDPIGLLGGENLYAYAPNTTGWVDPLGWMPWAEPVAVGHHLIPQSLARSTGFGPVADLFGSNTKTPTFFFERPYLPGSHEAIHAAQRPFVGSLQGAWKGTPAQLVRASYQGLASVSHIRGDLKIPATGQVIARNVTPKEAFSALLRWGREQRKPRG